MRRLLMPKFNQPRRTGLGRKERRTALNRDSKNLGAVGSAVGAQFAAPGPSRKCRSLVGAVMLFL